MLRAVAVGLAICLSQATVPDVTSIESHTNQLMGQILAAVSTKADDNGDLMGRLCDMVNEVETAVLDMTSTEDKDAEFALARLRSELDETNANLSSVRALYNATAKELSMLINQHRPLPAQLADAKARESDFMRQRELLNKECTEDMQGQRLRVDAINTDMGILEEAIEHLHKLSAIGNSDAPPPESVALLETESSATPKCDRATLAAQTLGPVVQCENDLIIPVTGQQGTISTLPPGEGMSYKKSRKCMFRIAPADIDILDRIELNFLGMDTVKDDDLVSIYDGPRPDPSKLLGSFSGNAAPPTVRSIEHNVMTVVFNNEKAMSAGFMANYKAVKVPLDRSSALNECSSFNGVPIVLTGEGGFISEDSRPEFASAVQSSAGTAYAAKMACKWLIQGLPGQTLRFHFTFLNTQTAMEYVTIFDGPSDDKGQEVLLHQSGTSIPVDVESTSSAIFITYNADFAVPGKGFHASWCVVGKQCPELPKPNMPPAAPIPNVTAPPFNASAPSPPAPPAPVPATPAVLPPPYPMQPPAPSLALSQVGLCANGCSGHGSCQPDTATCLCASGFSGADCSRSGNMEPDIFAMLLEQDSGLGGSDPVAPSAEPVKDECGDDSTIEATVDGLALINSDPVKLLLEQLKFELQRSLVYEHDTTNLTHRQCARDLHSLDTELEVLQQSILKLSKGISELDIKIQGMREKNSSLYTRLQSFKEYAAELAQQIKSRKTQTSTRSGALTTQLTSLQSMRDIITQLGSHTCRKAAIVASFTESPGVVCSGELLDTTKETDDPADCKSVCSVGCAGFSFTQSEGCKFYLSIEGQEACPGGTSTCSCFKK